MGCPGVFGPIPSAGLDESAKRIGPACPTVKSLPPAISPIRRPNKKKAPEEGASTETQKTKNSGATKEGGGILPSSGVGFSAGTCRDVS